mgnify:CR=1 FL=1
MKKGIWILGLTAALLAVLGMGGAADGKTEPLPARYDYRESGRALEVKNQGSLGTCWAFASLTALELSMPADERMDFSEDHMSLWDRFPQGQKDGGDYIMSMAYLLSWQGPVPEEADTYGDGVRASDAAAVKHIQEIRQYQPKDYEKIKQAIYEYGGVQSSFYSDLQGPYSDSPNYNRETASYYYDGEAGSNHDVVIVGWDDGYPRENFKKQPEGDGAFLCLNSWGEAFGDGGYFYISYYDTNIGTSNIAYTGIEEPDNYDRIYQTDLCGWVGQMGYEQDTAWFANVYTAEGNENLEAVGFYATGPDSEYEVYVLPEFQEMESMKDRKPAVSGAFEDAGYYTVPLKRAVRLRRGQRFAVVVKIKSPGKIHPVAIEYDAGDGKRKVDLSDGEGYLSHNGVRWDRAEEEGCNICLKAYTSKR